VLLVDDSPEDRHSFRRFLEHDQEQSFICLEAASAAEGLAQCRERRPDAVLLDYHLPDDEGLALLATLIAEHGLHAFAMLLVTGQGSEQLAVAAMKLGAHDYLVKGLHLQHHLGRAVASAIERARLQRALATSNTHLQHTEQALRIERDRFVTLVETVPGVVHAFQLKPDGTISFPYASPRIAEIYGISSEGLANDAGMVASLWHPDDVPRLLDTIELSRQQMTPWHEEFRVRNPARGERWIEGHSIPQREPDGSTIWYGVLTDITERKHAELALARSAQRLQILAEASRAFAEAGSEERALLTQIAHKIAGHLRAACTIRMLSEDGQNLDIAALGHYDPADLGSMQQSLSSWRIKLDDQVPAAIAARTGQSQFLPIIDREAFHASVSPEAQHLLERFFPHSLIVTPLQLHNRILGTLMLARNGSELPAFDADDLALAQDLAVRATLAIANAHLLQQFQAELAERRRAEAALHEREENLRIVTETAGVGLALVDAEHRYRYANQTYKEFLRLPSDDLAGQRVADVLGPLYDQLLRDRLERALQGEDVAELLDVPGEAGVIRHYEARLKIGTYRAEPVAVVVLSDITARMRAEAETREREHKLSTLLDILPLGIAILDEQRQVLYANPALKHITALSDASVQRQTYRQRQYLNAAGQPMAPEAFASARAFREHQLIQNVETGIIKEDGKQIWTNVSAAPVDFPDWKVVVATTDITERKNAELALARSAQRLRVLANASRAFAQAGANEQEVLDLVAQHIAETLQSSCTIRFLSHDAQWLDVVALGHYDPTLLEAMHALIKPERMPITDPQPAGIAARSGQPQFIPVVDAAALPALIPASQQSLLAIMLPHTILSLPLRIHEQIIGCLTFARSARELPPFDEDDLTLAQDLADRAALARRVEERTADLSIANAELARAARLKDEFLASMSHELRTPLNSILGRSEALQEEIYGALTLKQIEALQGIETSGRHLLALINDILDLSKIEADKLELHLEPVALSFICHSALQMVTQLARQKRVAISSTLDSTIETLPADERRLKQVLVNLLSNAVKFTPEGGKIGLDVQGDAERGAVTFTVWDTGIGIAEEDLQHLFKPFVQIDSRLNRHFEGTGLGLALVMRLVQAHGGSVMVASTPGQGSRFSVTLPWSHAEQASLQPVAETAATAIGGAAIEQVLVIEDSPAAVEQIKRYLSEMGAQVEVHARADGAVERAIELQPDVIVLDILLPDVVGWEILRQLKAELRAQHIPVLVVTVVDEPERARMLGAAGFLLKPIDRVRFTRIVQRITHTVDAPPLQTAFLLAPEPETPHTPQPIILLAEDNQATIDLMYDYLHAKGYAVMMARNGGEALLRARETMPALILMDIQMPGMDGLEAIRRMRADAALQGIPIIALTALAMPNDRERCLAAGADDYLAKPVNLRALIAAIQSRLQSSPRRT
jgi:PAS domain S-box-containing protein